MNSLTRRWGSFHLSSATRHTSTRSGQKCTLSSCTSSARSLGTYTPASRCFSSFGQIEETRGGRRRLEDERCANGMRREELIVGANGTRQHITIKIGQGIGPSGPRRTFSTVHTSQCREKFTPTIPMGSALGAETSLGRRNIHTSSVCNHEGIKRPAPGTGIKVHFQDAKGNLIKTVEGNEGDSLLDIAKEYDIDMEGACEGSVACSTCHVILNPEAYDLLEEPEDDENDMLDMAFGLTDTSRLGCQVKLKPELDGIVATLPSATRNFFVDGAKPTKH